MKHKRTESAHTDAPLHHPPEGRCLVAHLDKPADREKTAYSHLSDLEMAIKIRMLPPDAPDHEAVCIEARDRIVDLIQEVKRLNARVMGVPDRFVDHGGEK